MSRSTFFSRLIDTEAAPDSDADWAVRLVAIAEIRAAEGGRAASAADVVAFRNQMPGGKPFAHQPEAVAWLLDLEAESRSLETPPSESASDELRKFRARRRRRDPILGSLKDPFLNREGILPIVSIAFDLERGDPNYQAQPGDIDEDGDWNIPMGPLSYVFARPYGMIGELIVLGEKLERRYGWTPESARSWVVCPSVIPKVYPCRHEVILGESDVPTRFRFDVDAAMPPHLLRDRLRDLQREYRLRSAETKRRSIKQKNALAAIFSVQHNDGRSWSEACAAFNEMFPALAFTSPEDFAKRVRESYQSLMGEKIKWMRPSGSVPSQCSGASNVDCQSL